MIKRTPCPSIFGEQGVLFLFDSNINIRNCYLTLPTAKAGGFLFQPLLHWLIPYGIATSYTVSTSQIILFPYALRCSLIYIYADCICSPLVKMFILALVSLLCMVWHSGHSHTRTARFFTSGFLYPQQEQV